MVISGGVSLGAYEAGYNWAMIKMLSKVREHGTFAEPQLRSVAGASAGSINALMTAMYWCQKDDCTVKKLLLRITFFMKPGSISGLKILLFMENNPDNKSTLFHKKRFGKKGSVYFRADG